MWRFSGPQQGLCWLFVCSVSVLWCGFLAAYESARKREPATNLAFELTDLDARPLVLQTGDKPQFTVVCFLGTECPLARLYAPRLSTLARDFAKQGVRFIGLNSNAHDSPAEVRQFVKETGLTFPLAKDPGNKVADLFAAERMAEVFVVDHKLQIRYQGRVDDQYAPGISRGSASRDDLRLALDELLAGKSVSVARTETTGCLIGRVPVSSDKPQDSAITFSQQVSRILNQHCVECHRPGEIGPFSLTDYDEVAGWGETIIETIDTGRMPPWHADPAHGSFANERIMPEADKQVLRDWVTAGMPQGNPADLPPPLPERTSEWQLPRTPDLTLKMRDRPYQVPATGTIDYQYFVVDPGFTEDKWITAAQVIPGHRGVVHHCIVFIRPPDGSEFRGVGWLTGYVPGQRSTALPPGYARRVPARSKLVFQMHYTPNGIAGPDLTQVGMTFAPEAEITHEVYSLLALDQDFEIPPQAADYPVEARVKWFPKQGELLAIVPHMHVRGKGIQVYSTVNDKPQILLDVPRYDFNWQHVYELKQPIKLSEIDELKFTARFDNSKGNPANPDPTQIVTWGDQTWEEMAVTFFEIAVPRNPVVAQETVADGKPAVNPRVAAEEAAAEAKLTADVNKFVEEFFQRFDTNKNGQVERFEPPLSFRSYGFRQFDNNNDEILTRSEIEAAARYRLRSKSNTAKNR